MEGALIEFLNDIGNLIWYCLKGFKTDPIEYKKEYKVRNVVASLILIVLLIIVFSVI